MKKAFTIVELLTVMSIIVILMGIIIPSVGRVRAYSIKVSQHNQFRNIEAGLGMYEYDFGEYPPSRRAGLSLTEALVGGDLGGFHEESKFREDLKDGVKYLYAIAGNTESLEEAATSTNQQARHGPYIKTDDAVLASEVYGDITWFVPDFTKRYILCDKFTKPRITGYKTGMPIVYWRAVQGGNCIPHYEANTWVEPMGTKYYEYVENAIASIGEHPLNEKIFYDKIHNKNCPAVRGVSHNPCSYILLSAGEDGLYGTKDDMRNF